MPAKLAAPIAERNGNPVCFDESKAFQGPWAGMEHAPYQMGRARIMNNSSLLSRMEPALTCQKALYQLLRSMNKHRQHAQAQQWNGLNSHFNAVHRCHLRHGDMKLLAEAPNVVILHCSRLAVLTKPHARRMCCPCATAWLQLASCSFLCRHVTK